MKTINFNGFKGVIEFASYGNGRVAMELIDPNDGECIAIPTVNLPSVALEEDEVFIKEWSENHGIYKALADAGYLGPVLELVPTGMVYAIKCKLLIK